jgi:hypothetical protein
MLKNETKTTSPPLSFTDATAVAVGLATTTTTRAAAGSTLVTTGVTPPNWSDHGGGLGNEPY